MDNIPTFIANGVLKARKNLDFLYYSDTLIKMKSGYYAETEYVLKTQNLGQAGPTLYGETKYILNNKIKNFIDSTNAAWIPTVKSIFKVTEIKNKKQIK